MKSKFALLLAVLMIFPLCACGDENVEDATQTPEYSIKYDVKINPEFTVYADSELCVTDIAAENDDAQAVIDNVDVLGLSVNAAFEALTSEAKVQGYMAQEKGNTVDITILEKDDEKMPTCHICGGCGTIICLECNGTGICCDCERCAGTGDPNYAQWMIENGY